MSQLDKPNVVLSLAESYNTRGIDAFTNAVTNTLDQRKVNSLYIPVTNSVSGKSTLYLVKRPGFSRQVTNIGDSAQSPYLVEMDPNSLSSSSGGWWLFSNSSSQVRVSTIGSTVEIIASGTTAKPAYVDTTIISGTATVVLQCRVTAAIPATYRYFYASAIASWTEITDSDLTGLTVIGKMEHLDGYAFVLESRNRIYNSDVNSLANWSASSYITKSIAQDEPRGLARLGQQIIAFGANTMEVFRNAGNATGSTLVRVPELTQKYGLNRVWDIADTRAYSCQIGSRLYWVAPKSTLQGTMDGVLSYDGSRVEKVSNDAIDRILEDRTKHYGVYRLRIGGNDGVAILLDAPDLSPQRWLMFFPHLNEWFEWNSTVICPVTAPGDPGIVLGLGVAASNGHSLYYPSLSDNWRDDGTDYSRIHQFQMPGDGAQRHFMRWCGLQGTQERTACTESLAFSDDDGQTWNTVGTIDRTSDKQNLYRCGSYRRRLVRFTNSSNHEGRLERFLARVD